MSHVESIVEYLNYHYGQDFLQEQGSIEEDHTPEGVSNEQLRMLIVDMDNILESRHGEAYRLTLDYLKQFVTELESVLEASGMSEGQLQETVGLVVEAWRSAVARTHNSKRDIPEDTAGAPDAYRGESD